ncbi:MAG: hypothetical protein ACLU0O_01475 [Collinsella sp.]
MLEDTALELGAMVLSPLSKTEYALAAPALCGGYQGDYALATCTCRRSSLWRACATDTSAVVPQELVTLNAVRIAWARCWRRRSRRSTVQSTCSTARRSCSAGLSRVRSMARSRRTWTAIVFRRHPDGRWQA